MSTPSSRLLFWTPRILGIGIALFLAVFAADVFGQGYSFWETAGALLIHLIPTFLLLIGMALAWRWEWVGALIFLGFAIWYLATAWGRFDISAYLIVSGIPALVGLLFLADWVYRRRRG